MKRSRTARTSPSTLRSLSQRLFLNVSELQLRVDGVDATSRHRDAVDVAVGASTRRVREPRQFRDGVVSRRNSATVQITTPSRARHLDEYTQNVLEEETRYDDTDWLTLMMIYSGTGFLADANAKDKNNRPGASRGVPSCISLP